MKTTFHFTKLPISLRLILVGGVFAISLITLSLTGYRSLVTAGKSTEELNKLVNESTMISALITNVQSNLISTVNQIANGSITWLEGEETIANSSQLFSRQWHDLVNSDFYQSEAKSGRSEFTHRLEATIDNVTLAYERFNDMSNAQSRAYLELFLLNDMGPLVNPFLNAANIYSAALTDQATQSFAEFENTLSSAILSDVILIFSTAIITLIAGYFTYRSIMKPVRRISETIRDVKTDAFARSGLQASRDELSTLGHTLDSMLDEKNDTLHRIESENEAINNSVIELLEGTSQLSDRDLTVRIKVREDVTGPVADAMNMATQEIAEALAKIRQISELVSAASTLIDEQSKRVTAVSDQENVLVRHTIEKLEAVSSQMVQIAKWSQASNQVAKKATATTDSAFESVSNTVTSMEEIRHSISETEKRIKRLSERSQEISSIIDIINSIAERTHVLALNASMQAAAAGEAGRGFAVVADEVQRLAESSRDSTNQISVLVRNIQTETAAAVDTMNASISEVVSGSKLARLAGEQMKETQSTTKNLAQAVAKISEQSILQARESDKLKIQSNQIQQSSEKTSQELKRQAEQARRLASAANMLTSTISVFSIPEKLLEQNLTADLLMPVKEGSVVHLETLEQDNDNIPVVKAIG